MADKTCHATHVHVRTYLSGVAEGNAVKMGRSSTQIAEQWKEEQL